MGRPLETSAVLFERYGPDLRDGCCVARNDIRHRDDDHMRTKSHSRRRLEARFTDDRLPLRDVALEHIEKDVGRPARDFRAFRGETVLDFRQLKKAIEL